MGDNQPTLPIRGAIKTTVSSSTETLVAGQEFSVFVTVQNPFEVPLILHRVSTYLPTELLDVDKSLRDHQALELEERIIELEQAGTQLGLPTSTISPGRPGIFGKLLRGITRISVRFFGIEFDFRPERVLLPVVARDVTGETSEVSIGMRLPFIGTIKQTLKKQVKDSEGEETTKEALKKSIKEEIGKFKEAVQFLNKAEQPSKTLQSGNSTTRVFTLRSLHSVWFRPASYRLHIEVEYELAGVRNVDTIEHLIQIKSSLVSMIMGSILGGLGGWFTSKGSSVKFEPAAIIELFVSLVLSAMAVVLFARKKDVQPLIAIEDFWGGVAIGFLVAYSGPKIFEKLIPNPPTGS